MANQFFEFGRKSTSQRSIFCEAHVNTRGLAVFSRSMDHMRLKNRLLEAQKVVITTHINPDGDALGSSLGLQWALQKAGISSTVVLPNAAPAFYGWMPGMNRVVVFECQTEEATQLLLSADFLFVLDFNEPGRVGRDMETVLRRYTGFSLMIDHHPQPSADFSEVISDTTMSSTCEMVGHFLHAMGWFEDLDQAGATCLYTGLVTDTGSFRFPSTGVQTLRMAADLKERGANQVEIFDQVMDSYTPSRIKLLGLCLNSLEMVEGKQTSLLTLSKAQLDACGYQKGDTEGFVNYGLSISGQVFSAILIEHEDRVKVSLRSKGNFDVNVFSRAFFNGGGHKNAAGGVYEGALADAKEHFYKAIETVHP